MKCIIFILLCAINFAGCVNLKDEPDLTWLNVPPTERYKLIERHFRGLDTIMVEVGYRYNELYWAGLDRNWELANYQIEKIDLAIKLGIEKRPKRAANAQMIFPVLDDLKKATSNKSYEVFYEKFTILQQACNSCHVAEEVSFFKVGTPSERLSPLRVK